MDGNRIRMMTPDNCRGRVEGIGHDQEKARTKKAVRQRESQLINMFYNQG